MASPNYRFTVAIGSGAEGERILNLCNLLCEALDLKNVKGDPNYSALFRRGIEALAEKLNVKQ